jgi:hypothetical protein
VPAGARCEAFAARFDQAENLRRRINASPEGVCAAHSVRARDVCGAHSAERDARFAFKIFFTSCYEESLWRVRE